MLYLPPFGFPRRMLRTQFESQFLRIARQYIRQERPFLVWRLELWLKPEQVARPGLSPLATQRRGVWDSLLY
jgi:hypothetical protein